MRRLSKVKEISREAKVRLKFLEFGREHPVTVTCRRFGISRSTYYRWKKRFNPNNLGSLENRSRRPKNVRKPTWSVRLVERIRELREEYPQRNYMSPAQFLQQYASS
ncbi:helix-turn-helix domain-containing protein [Thermacetogenium phaeum]|uniref:helix-turn-helix domain-containing protein n=1 Tax=Thermacetogenium phaeum TaxID=85874 RepID=UPI00130EEA36